MFIGSKDHRKNGCSPATSSRRFGDYVNFDHMYHALRSIAVSLLVVSSSWALAGEPRSEGQANVQVSCSRASAFVSVSISSFRKIGVVTIEVRNATGLTLYKEEGKALTPELVRRLDKGGFPRGAHTLLVTAKDFSISQVFTVE